MGHEQGGARHQGIIDCFNRNGGQGAVGNPASFPPFGTPYVHQYFGSGYKQDFNGGGGGNGAIFQQFYSGPNENPANPAYWVHGTIWNKYGSIGGANSLIGWPTSDEMEAAPSPTGTVGRLNRFEGGAIYYWREGYYAGSAFYVQDDSPAGLFIARKHDELGGTDGNQQPDPDLRYDLGFPRSDTQEAARNPAFGTTGEVNFFEGGVGARGAAIYGVRGKGTFVVYGRIFDKHEDHGGTGDDLGFPVSDPAKAIPSGAGTGAEGVVQWFEGTDGHGRVIHWRRLGNAWDGEAYVTRGSILDLYRTLGSGSKLGFPQSDERAALSSPQGTNGYVAIFEDGSIHSASGVGTFATWGPIWHKYKTIGSGGFLGFPSTAIRNSDPSPFGTPGQEQFYQGGAIYTSGTGTYALSGLVFKRYNGTQDTDSPFGFPTSEANLNVASGATSLTGQMATFEGGRIYEIPAISGTRAFGVHAPILDAYLAAGGHSGPLGFPIDDQRKNASGEWYQDFEGGTLPATIRVVAPNGGENWTIGSVRDITWTSSGITGYVKLDYSTNNGASWSTILTSTPNDGYEPWTVPNTPTSQARVRVSSVTLPSVSGASLAAFSIGGRPVSNDQSVTTAEDTPKSITLAASDPEGDALTYTIVAPPSHGTLSGTAPNVVYSPAFDYYGSDSFAFKVNDGTLDSNTATVSVTVLPVNDPPVVGSDKALIVDEDAPNTALGIIAPTDPDGDTLTLTVTGIPLPDKGEVRLRAGGQPVTEGQTLSVEQLTALEFDPALDANGGAGAFVYMVSDGKGGTATAFVTLSIRAINDKPVAYNVTVSTDEDTAINISFLATDVDGDPLTFYSASAPQHGTLSGTGSNRTYTPAAQFHGSDSFTYRVSDGSVFSDTAAVSITVKPLNDHPTAVGQAVSTPEDTPKAVTLSGTDGDGDSLGFLIVSPPVRGRLSGTAPNLTYTPDRDYHGPDSFTFKVNDGKADSDVATVAITVSAVDDPPVALAQSVSTSEDTPIPIALAGTDADGDSLTFQLLSETTNGKLSGTVSNLTYTPNPNYSGADSFTFKASDGRSDSGVATISISIGRVNDAPEATPQSISTPEDTAKPIVLGGTDIDGDSLTFAVVSGPAHGSLMGLAPNLTYTPAPNYHGLDTLTFRANDGTVDSSVTTILLIVLPVNDAPVASAQSVSTSEDTDRPITLAADDVDGDPLTFTLVTPPTHGSLSGTAPNLTYTPNPNYSGPDSFTFKAGDGIAESNVAAVSLTVTAANDAPVAASQSLTTAEDIVKSIVLTATDAEEDSVSFALVGGPAHGTLSGTLPNVTYAPAANYHGTDSFTFRANDGTSDSDPATVSITVTPVNDPPHAQGMALSTSEDVARAIALGATDVDGDALTYTLVSQPAHGSLAGNPPSLTYTPAANYNGVDSFTFKASDGRADSNIATVAISIGGSNDSPVAAGQSVTTAEDSGRPVQLQGTDPDGDALTYNVLSGPSHGTLAGVAPNLTYTPHPDYYGADSFTFKVSDGAVDSPAASVEITVSAVNDAPTAQGRAVSTVEDIALSISLIGSDVDGDSLTYTVVAVPQHGTLSGSGSRLIYTPVPNFHGADKFTFHVDDGLTVSADAMVTITVGAANDSPVALDQNLIAAEDTSRTIVLSATDTDGDGLTFAIVASPTHGRLSETGPNLTYTPEPDYNGSDSFSFRSTDGVSDSNTAVVKLTIVPVNDRPVAADAIYEVREDQPHSVTLSAADVDGDSLTYAVTTFPAHGTLSGSAPDLIYTPSPNYRGPDSFAFVANDGEFISNSATISITVSPVNDPPVAQAGPNRTIEAAGTLTTVGLDGSGSTDPDGDTLTFLWRKGSTQLATGPQPTVMLSVGTHTLELTVTDAAGATSSDSVVVVVHDSTPPGLILPTDLTVNRDHVGGAHVTFEVSVSDAVPGATVVCVPASGSLFPVGVTVVACTARDTFGNTTERTFKVEVVNPDSDQGRVTAAGTIPASSRRAVFKLVGAMNSHGRITGSFSFTDQSQRKSVRSTRFTAIDFDGTRVRIFGKARIGRQPELDFMLLVDDLGRRPSEDRFRLELSSGEAWGLSPLVTGHVTVRPPAAR